ncbi:hypothetical protein [Tsuneonella sp. HG222]
MSKQLTLSAAFSIFATVLFVLSATPNTLLSDASGGTPGGLAAPTLHTLSR